MSASNSLTVLQTRATRAIAGVSKNLSATASINLAGVSFTPTSLNALLQAYANLVTALLAAHAQLHGTVLSERTQRKQVLAVLLALEGFVSNLFGPSSTTLGDFGFTPKKAVKVPVATKAEAQVKSKATRVARGTMGKKEKLGITGESTASTPPATTPATTNGATPKV
jgi:hypothetical protein